MNIDERLEALTASVELLAAMHGDNEKRMEQFDKRSEQFERAIAQLSRQNAQLESLVEQIAEGTVRLLNAVEAHEHRISDLEERNRPQQ